jgi:hypothetical protein
MIVYSSLTGAEEGSAASKRQRATTVPDQNSAENLHQKTIDRLFTSRYTRTGAALDWSEIFSRKGAKTQRVLLELR